MLLHSYSCCGPNPHTENNSCLDRILYLPATRLSLQLTHLILRCARFSNLLASWSCVSATTMGVFRFFSPVGLCEPYIEFPNDTRPIEPENPQRFYRIDIYITYNYNILNVNQFPRNLCYSLECRTLQLLPKLQSGMCSRDDPLELIPQSNDKSRVKITYRYHCMPVLNVYRTKHSRYYLHHLK